MKGRLGLASAAVAVLTMTLASPAFSAAQPTSPLAGVGMTSSGLAGSQSPSSTKWRSNIWQTPTRSIMCRYFLWSTPIICTSQRTRLSVRLGDGSGIDLPPARLAPLWSVHHVPGRFEPILEYGVPWKSDEFRCRAQTTGVRCWVDPGLRELLGNH